MFTYQNKFPIFVYIQYTFKNQHFLYHNFEHNYEREDSKFNGIYLNRKSYKIFICIFQLKNNNKIFLNNL